MKVKEISLNEYQSFIQNHPANPFQGTGMYHRLARPKIYGGFDESGSLVIAAMGDYRPFKKLFNYFYIPYGPIAKDPFDMKVNDAFFSGLKKLHGKSRTIALQMDPAIEIAPMDGFGQIQEGFDNTKYRDEMEAIGFTLLPKTTGISKILNPRQVAIIDLADLENYPGIMISDTKCLHVYSDEEQIEKMKPRTKRYIRQSVADYILVEDGSMEDLIYCGQMSGDAKNFEFFNKAALEAIVSGYGKDCAIRHCYIDVPLYLKNLEGQEAEILKDVRRLQANPKANKKLKAKEEELERIRKEMETARSWNTDKLSLCCGLFLYSPRETYFLASGIDRRYKKYQGAARLNWDEMKRSKERGAWKYNLLGIAGTYQPDDPNESLISFKRDLGAHVAEYQGCMFYKIQPMLFNQLVQMYWNQS